MSTAFGPAQLPDFQIVGGPAWLATDRFDVTGTADSGAPLPALLRQLVEDRFAVRTRFESRDMPVYALVVVRGDGTHRAQTCPTPFAPRQKKNHAKTPCRQGLDDLGGLCGSA